MFLVSENIFDMAIGTVVDGRIVEKVGKRPSLVTPVSPNVVIALERDDLVVLARGEFGQCSC